MNKHATDAVSAGFGTTFLAVVAAWLLNRFGAIDLPSPDWLIAIGLVVAGAVGLIASIAHVRGGESRRPRG